MDDFGAVLMQARSAAADYLADRELTDSMFFQEEALDEVRRAAPRRRQTGSCGRSGNCGGGRTSSSIVDRVERSGNGVGIIRGVGSSARGGVGGARTRSSFGGGGGGGGGGCSSSDAPLTPFTRSASEEAAMCRFCFEGEGKDDVIPALEPRTLIQPALMQYLQLT